MIEYRWREHPDSITIIAMSLAAFYGRIEKYSKMTGRML